MTNCPSSLRGDLTKWMQEIATGVYVGNFNSRIREELWKRIENTVGSGSVTMSFTAQNEIGYDFKTIHSHREVCYFDGLPLVRVPSSDTSESDLQYGFSDAAHFHNAKKFANIRNKRNFEISTDSAENDFKVENEFKAKNVSSSICNTITQTKKTATNNEEMVCDSYCSYWKEYVGKISKNFVVIDFETTGLDSRIHKIIEMGAVKFVDGEIEEFQTLINIYNNNDNDSFIEGCCQSSDNNSLLPNEIIKLTGITQDMLESDGVSISVALIKFIEFIGKLPIVGYNVPFDLAFLNAAILSSGKESGISFSGNKVIDISRFIKKERMFLQNYKLETVLREYDVAESVPHRALTDARLTARLVFKVKGLLKFLS